MSLVLLNHFVINNVKLSYFINTENDATLLINDNSGKRLILVDYEANLMFLPERKILGRFFLDDNQLWEYKSVEGLRVVTGSENLIKAEMEVIKQLINSGEIIL